MIYKKIVAYAIAMLIGASAVLLLNYNEKSFSIFQSPLVIFDPQNQEIAHAEQTKDHSHQEHAHMHDEHDHEHEENVVKLNEEQIRKMNLQMRQAESGSLMTILSTRGKIIIQPDHLAHIIPKVPGIAYEAYKNIGDQVKEKEILAILESQEMADMKAAYLAALSKHKLATSTLKREENLYRERISPGQDYLNAKNAFEESLINVQLARQKLLSFGLNPAEIDRLNLDSNDSTLRLYPIRSPIQGTVIMRHITKGEYIENTKNIYEIADLSTVWVDIGIYPKDLDQVKKGQIVEIAEPRGNQVSQAQLIYVSPIVADETITAKAIAQLDNPQELWLPGSFVKVNIAIDQHFFPIVIPKEAVQSIEGQNVVFVSTSEGFEKRTVALGQSDSKNVEIISGLQAGEQYVAINPFLLKAELGKSTAEHEH